jgi:Domain of unknown function (DUF4129)
VPLPLQLVAGVGSVVTLRPDPDQARSWVERELSRPEYQEDPLTRFLGWLQDLWQQLRLNALDASPLSTAAAVVVVVVLVVLVALVVSLVRREPGRGAGEASVLLPGRASPDEHRGAAEHALADGAYDRALVEAFRAVAVRAVQRGVVEERPGLTADELAAELGPAFPDHAERLRAASLLFDLVFYGDQPATEADARSVLDLDDSLRAARPARRDTTAPPPTAAVPR